MSDVSQGPGWWQASDDKWYPPDQVPGPDPAPDPGAGWATPPTGWGTPGAGPPAPGAPGAGYGAPSYGPPGPGYGPVGGFAPSPYGAYGTQPSAQGMATASMVLGIVALVLFWCWFLAILPALVGLVLGIVALGRIKNGTVSDQGRGMAVAGVVCSGIALVITVGIFVLVAAS